MKISKDNTQAVESGAHSVEAIHEFNRKGLWFISVFALILSLSIFYVEVSLADSPDNIKMPDRHSIEVKGKINLYRVQVEGMDLGKDGDKAHAEVFVTLDSNPKMVYALEIHKGSPNSNRVIADTLRDAYINNIPVKLYHQINMKRKNNFKILMVQLNR